MDNVPLHLKKEVNVFFFNKIIILLYYFHFITMIIFLKYTYLLEMIPDMVTFRCDFMYNSSYTPLFNPIEEFFGTIKGKLSFYRIANIN
jgi:hypothetical protein